MATQVLSVAARADLKALDPAVTKAAILQEVGREGTFILNAGTPPVSDPQEAVFLVSSHTSGYYWERVFSGALNFLWFGADRNYLSTTNNWTEFQKCHRFMYWPGRGAFIYT